jgi:sigma-E factor negative regulatory protein RseC
METPEGRVVKIVRSAAGDRVVVDVDAAAACPRCAAGRGCGAGILQGSGKVRRVEALVDSGVTLSEGDRVRLQLDGSSVLGASAIVYGIPLAGAAVGAAFAYLLGLGDAGASVLAIGGLAAGFLVGRRRLQRRDCLAAFTPTAVGRLSAGS